MMPRLKMSICRNLVYFVTFIAVCELFILNAILLYAFVSLKHSLGGIFSESDAPFLDKMMQTPFFQNLFYKGKNGAYLTLMQETLGRIFIMSENQRQMPNNSLEITDFDGMQINFLGLDVSHSREATYLYRRIRSRKRFFDRFYKPLIVDIGANDGLVSSNSFNFIQWGWSGILVDPQLSELRLAKQNLRNYIDPYNEKVQKVTFVNAVLGMHDGMEDFVLVASSMGMESHVFDSEDQSDHQSGQLIVKVPSMTVATFARKYDVPTNFGILSVDAEGMGDKILHQWIDRGFRPAYIVYEQLHNKEDIFVTTQYLENNQYRFLSKLGWNYLFENNSFDKK